MYKHVLVNTRYIFRGMGVRKVSDNKSDIQGHPRSSVFVPFDRAHMTSY